MPDQPERLYESLLSKYLAVWLWSIVFGAISGLTYTFIAYRPFESKFRPSVLLSAILIGLGLITIISSLSSLYRGLIHFIIPNFLLGREADPEDFAISLRRAFFMLVVAIFVRLTMIFIDTVVSVFGPGF
jgi:hypothetical protein